MITIASLADLSAEQLRRVLAIKEQIAALESQLQELGAEEGEAGEERPVGTNGRRKTHRISAAGRARIIAAQKRRWAAVHRNESQAAPVTRASSRRRRISASGRANIAAAARARWAKYRSEHGL